MITKFSLYDFIAVAVPGMFFVWLLSALADIRIPGLVSSSTGDVAETSFWVVSGYVAGLLLQGLSQQFTEAALLRIWKGFPSARWLAPDDRHFTPEYRGELGTALSRRFGLSLPAGPVTGESRPEMMKRNQEIFYRCYRNIEGLSDLPLTFNAQYGLFRTLLTVFCLLIGFEVAILVRSALMLVVPPDALLRLGLWMVCAVVTYWRVTKRADDFAKAVYDVFLAQSSESMASGSGA